jgi:hypothetical protein
MIDLLGRIISCEASYPSCSYPVSRDLICSVASAESYLIKCKPHLVDCCAGKVSAASDVSSKNNVRKIQDVAFATSMGWRFDSQLPSRWEDVFYRVLCYE